MEYRTTRLVADRKETGHGTQFCVILSQNMNTKKPRTERKQKPKPKQKQQQQHIFISYSRVDKEFARYLRAILEHETFLVWMDEKGLSAGDGLVRGTRKRLLITVELW